MNKPIILINGKNHEIKEVKGKDWRIMGEFFDKEISFTDKTFMDEQANFIANFFDNVSSEEILELPLEEIFPKAMEIRNYMINKISEKLNAIEKNVETGEEESKTP